MAYFTKASERAKAAAKPDIGTLMTAGSLPSGFDPDTVMACAVFIESVAIVGRLIGTRHPSLTQN